MKTTPFKKSLIIIFGATGDLTKRKLLPALYKLHQKKLLQDAQPIICVGRKDLSQENFIDHLGLNKQSPGEQKKISSEFVNRIHYYQLDFSLQSPECPAACKCFEKYLKVMEQKYGTKGHRIFFLATPPNIFDTIASILKSCKLLGGPGQKQIVFEKPFGHDLASAMQLNRSLLKKFPENKIYRIDHYLGKALVQDLLVFRFANIIFDQIWNNRYIEKIHITASESVGIGTRGAYYEKSGAIRDMLQNHIMELLALTTMEMPQTFDPDAIRDEKAKVIRKLVLPDSNNIIIGQYTQGSIDHISVNGYREETKVAKGSTTETFIALKTMIANKRWQGVPIILKTGKRLAKTYAEIDIELKNVASRLFRLPSKAERFNNSIKIRIQPDTRIGVTFNTRRPGAASELVKVDMDFCHHCMFGNNTPEAYEAIFLGLMRQDKTMFTRWDMVKASWKYIDKVREIAEQKRLVYYQAGSEGPKVDKLYRSKVG